MIFDRTSETGRIVHALTDERDRLRLDVEAEHARAEILRKVLESTVAARDVAVARAERSEAEVARLRAIETAARELVENWDGPRDTTLGDIEALRVALVSTSDLPKP